MLNIANCSPVILVLRDVFFLFPVTNNPFHYELNGGYPNICIEQDLQRARTDIMRHIDKAPLGIADGGDCKFFWSMYPLKCQGRKRAVFEAAQCADLSLKVMAERNC